MLIISVSFVSRLILIILPLRLFLSCAKYLSLYSPIDRSISFLFSSSISPPDCQASNSLSGLLKPDVKEEVIGSAEVLTIFKVSKIGKVAGSKVTNGEIASNLNARLIRDGNVLYTGSINSIFREKNAAKQVSAGLECGITLKDFADFKEKDVIEVYKVTETERRI